MLYVTRTLIAVSFAFCAVQAQAATVIVTGGTGSPSKTNWGVIATENTGTAVISNTAPRDGTGSIELRGDRTRFQLGVQTTFVTSGFNILTTTNLMPLSAVTGLSFDWRLAGDTISGYNKDYTPALRLLVQDGSKRSELIWEGVYNNTYGNTQRDTWYSSTFDDSFYQYVTGSGVTLSGGSQVNKTLQSWIADNYSSSAYVSAISVGDGSGALPTYHAFVDNVSLRTTSGTTTYNFEVAAVPEPASWAMMIGGFGMIGAAMRRRARTVVAAA